jgi:DNA-binding MarR family transcriptional regulator
MKPWLEQPDFAAMGLEELLTCWSGMLMWAGIRPMFQRMIEANLSFSEQVVLQSLAHGDMSVADVADCLYITHSAASRAVDRLVEDGFVRRTEHPVDRRQKLLTLSPAGEELVANFERVMAGAIRPLIAGLNYDQQEQFRALIATMLGDAHRAAAPGQADAGQAVVQGVASVAP